MSLIDRLLQQEIISEVWQQLYRRLGTEGRVQQLFSLQPIDLYHTTTQFEVDGAVIEVDIESYLENLLKRRMQRTKNLITMGRIALDENRAYNFHVIVTGKMDYTQASRYLNHHFAGKDYYFSDRAYHLHIGQIRLREEDGQMVAEADVRGYAKKGWYTKRAKGTLLLTGKPAYQHDCHMITISGLDYSLHHTDWVTRLISRWYHREIRHLLQDILQYSLEEDLFNGKVMAQHEMNKRQNQSNFWVQGMITGLELQRIYYDQQGIQAVLMAAGKMELRR